VTIAKPPPLKVGDDVRVIAPASPFDRESFEKGLAVLSSRYRVHFDEGIFSSHRYHAGHDDRRLGELEHALNSKDGRALFCARGGYGTMRLLGKVDLQRAPLKTLVGFSDITALHLAMQKIGRVSIHAPVLTQLGKQSIEVQQRLFHLLESVAPPPPLMGNVTLVPGAAEGRLIGGNLSVMTRLLGTPFFPEVADAVLLLEDVGERPYRLDRMWTHLQLAGVFRKVRGIVLGDFTGCDDQQPPLTALEVLRSLAEETGLPCAGGFAIGHGEVNWPVPLGCRVRLDATGATLSFSEGAVEAATT
jgi:muramoyltetrapeptide carboxypeptidase